MLTKKLFYFIFPVLLLVIIGFLLFAFRGKKTSKQGTDTKNSNISTSNKSLETNNDEIAIETPSGEVTLNNFKKTPKYQAAASYTSLTRINIT